jgi:hypothetical protein
MRLIEAVPRQPTRSDIDDCDRQIALWQRRYRAAPTGSHWASVCASIADEWLDLRCELTAALEPVGGRQSL